MRQHNRSNFPVFFDNFSSIHSCICKEKEDELNKGINCLSYEIFQLVKIQFLHNFDIKIEFYVELQKPLKFNIK